MTHPSAVDSPEATSGSWSFGGVISRIAGTAEAKHLVIDWLKSFEVGQYANSFYVRGTSRTRHWIIEPWKEADGQKGVPDDEWSIDLGKAPFRLLAIVNRIDLAGCEAPVERLDQCADGSLSPGEGRLVYGAYSPINPSAVLPFTVILEFALPGSSMADVRQWARQWHELAALEFGDALNSSLRAITNRFAISSQLKQIRTNMELTSGDWELREYRLNRDRNRLALATVKQSPDHTLNGTSLLGSYVNEFRPSAANRIQIPNEYKATPFLGASARAQEGRPWAAPSIVPGEARHDFALITCAGCHRHETATNFLHISNRSQGGCSTLSLFLTGGEANDPIDQNVSRRFNDLKKRSEFLESVLGPDTQLLAVPTARFGRVH